MSEVREAGGGKSGITVTHESFGKTVMASITITDLTHVDVVAYRDCPWFPGGTG